MPLSHADILNLSNGQAKLLEIIAASTTAAYSSRVIAPNRMVRLVANDGGVVKLCREYIHGNRFGRDPEVPADALFESTAGDSVIDGAEGDILKLPVWEKAITTNQPTLDKTGGTIAVSHVLEVNLADQDDVIYQWLNKGFRSRYGRSASLDRAKIPASKALEIKVRHNESNASNPMQYGIEEYRRAASNAKKWWDGSAWQTSAQWVDITGSGSTANFTDAITSDETGEDIDGIGGGSVYRLALRSKADASETSHIEDLGVYETVTLTDNDGRISSGEKYEFITTHWTRVGVITDGNSKSLWVSEMGQAL